MHGNKIAHSRFSGFSKLYHQSRPVAPRKVGDIVLAYLEKTKADIIADLGCGTGLSTSVLLPFSQTVIGIEPNDDMRNQAIKNYLAVKFIKGSSYDTGFEPESIDAVTCSQSFHWMEPRSTLIEINRILKPAGVLAVYDCLWPVSVNAHYEAAWHDLFKAAWTLRASHHAQLPEENQWPKSEHLSNMQASGFFSFTRQLYFDQELECSKKRFKGLAMSQGLVQSLVKNNIEEIFPVIETFQNQLKGLPEISSMRVSYSMIIAVK